MLRTLSIPLAALALTCACAAPTSKSEDGGPDSGIVIGSNGCISGWTKCGDSDGGVCTNTQTDPDNCNACGTACMAMNASPACVAGACTVDTCNTGWADCDLMPQNGCEVNLTSDIMNCGACTNVCAPANGTPACILSNCAIASCNTGFADCDQSAVNGCETDTQNDPLSCGTCGNACSPPDGGADAGPLCVTGVCQ